MLNTNLDQCEIRCSPQLCRMVGRRGDQKRGIGAELAAERIPAYHMYTLVILADMVGENFFHVLVVCSPALMC